MIGVVFVQEDMDWNHARALLPKRLDKHLRDSSNLSISLAREALKSGRVRIVASETPDDSRICPERIVFSEDKIFLDQRLVVPRIIHETQVLNKPLGMTTTMRDPNGRCDISKVLPDLTPGVYPAGRLDRETSGALLLTSDGDLAHCLLRPNSGVEKHYWLWVDSPLELVEATLPRFVSGIELAAKAGSAKPVMARAKSACLSAYKDEHCILRVVLTSGLNRQIRRMCSISKLRLIALHRETFAGVSSPPEASRSRVLLNSEVAELWAQAGGMEFAYRRRFQSLVIEAGRAHSKGEPLLRLERWLATALHSP